MLRRITIFLGALLLALVSALIVLLAGMRTKSPAVLKAVRKFNRAVSNPQQMESAGKPGAYASVIRHRGRKSGKPFETPVGVVATNGEFIIALPYGLEADWLKNVLASGAATIVNEGHTYQVGQPEIISTEEVAEHFAPKEQRTLRWFGVDQCLRVRSVGPEDSPQQITDLQ